MIAEIFKGAKLEAVGIWMDSKEIGVGAAVVVVLVVLVVVDP
jgi:hypothetical protein